jgi:hypothetical protein
MEIQGAGCPLIEVYAFVWKEILVPGMSGQIGNILQT